MQFAANSFDLLGKFFRSLAGAEIQTVDAAVGTWVRVDDALILGGSLLWLVEFLVLFQLNPTLQLTQTNLIHPNPTT